VPHQAFAAELFGLAAEADRPEVVMELGEVAALSTQALVDLVKLRRKLLATGRRLTLCNLQPAVEEVLEVSKLNRWFAIRREVGPVEPPRLQCRRRQADLLDRPRPYHIAQEQNPPCPPRIHRPKRKNDASQSSITTRPAGASPTSSSPCSASTTGRSSGSRSRPGASCG
jgi:anti-anti-sigma factor